MAHDPSNGDLYIDMNGEVIYRYSFNGSGELVGLKVLASGLSGATGLAVDASHDVYVDEGNQVLEFGSSGKQAGVTFGSGLLAGSAGIAVDSSGDVYAGNPSRGNVAVFGPPEPYPYPTIDNFSCSRRCRLG